MAYVASGSEFVANTTFARSQAQPDGTRLANGNFIVAWTDANFNTTAGRVIGAQIFRPDGTPVGSELALFSTVNAAINPTIAGLTNGQFVAFTTGLTGLIGRIFDSSGTPVGPEFTVTSKQLAYTPEAVALANGGFAVAWHDTRSIGTDVSGSGVHVTTYDQNGVAITSDVLVNSSFARP
jgi:hypothetical protein